MSFSWIENDYVGFTALDADPDDLITGDELGVSGVFVGQTKEVSFRLGNTGSSDTDFDCTVSGVNATIIDDVEFSVDNGLTWASTVNVAGVGPNEVSDLIRCRYTPGEGEITGVGSFLIRVDES